VLEYNEEKDIYVQRSIAAQQARDAKAVEAEKREAAKAEMAKKARFDRITTVLDLSQPEYKAMRKTNFFAQAKNTEASNFHRKEKSSSTRKSMRSSPSSKCVLRRRLTLSISTSMLILRRLFGSRRSLGFTPS
jgi:hypothetical protein